jgi:hypothetical protein
VYRFKKFGGIAKFAPNMRQMCAKCAPNVRQMCAKCAPNVRQICKLCWLTIDSNNPSILIVGNKFRPAMCQQGPSHEKSWAGATKMGAETLVRKLFRDVVQMSVTIPLAPAKPKSRVGQNLHAFQPNGFQRSACYKIIFILTTSIKKYIVKVIRFWVKRSTWFQISLSFELQ